MNLIKKRGSPLLAFCFAKKKTKNSILRLKVAGEPSKEATSQQPLFPTGGG